jgi:transcriptional repressor NrdR
MRCPFCHHADTQVKDSRSSEDGSAIRRRRQCPSCEARFTTFEREQIRELMITKSNGKRKPFDRNKLIQSLMIATRKRPIDADAIEIAVSRVARALETGSDNEATTKRIGELVMHELRAIDHISYVRYASVYRAFNEVKDFEDFVENESLG